MIDKIGTESISTMSLETALRLRHKNGNLTPDEATALDERIRKLQGRLPWWKRVWRRITDPMLLDSDAIERQAERDGRRAAARRKRQVDTGFGIAQENRYDNPWG